jgi:hypothetical protein
MFAKRTSAKNPFAESQLGLFSSDLMQHQFKRLWPNPEICAKGTIEDKDREEDQTLDLFSLRFRKRFRQACKSPPGFRLRFALSVERHGTCSTREADYHAEHGAKPRTDLLEVGCVRFALVRMPPTPSWASR